MLRDLTVTQLYFLEHAMYKQSDVEKVDARNLR